LDNLNMGIKACGVILLWATAAVAMPAQKTGVVPQVQTKTVAPTVTFTTLYNFCAQGGSKCTDGENPGAGALLQGSDGNLYGTTLAGGAHLKSACGTARDGCGVIFRITTDGTLTVLHKFDGTDGFNPSGALIQDANDKFYGTTYMGGSGSPCRLGCGTVFSVTDGGKLTTLHSFNVTDGYEPFAGVLQGTDGKFYGTTTQGGTSGNGAVFSIASDGALKTLVSFGYTNGSFPAAGLVQGNNGMFYGTTNGGGAKGDGGTVFSMTAGGVLKTLYDFQSLTGYSPYAGLVHGTDGDFYGAASAGGGRKVCGEGGALCGTIFKMTPHGTLTTLYTFCLASNCSDGNGPYATLIQGSDGNFYGTTTYGGANDNCQNVYLGCGTVFRITPNGTLETLHSFDGTDGDAAFAGLVQDTNGNFYGTTQEGGANNKGTVFSMSVGLGPFIETRPTSGTVGTAVTILGTNLTDVTNVRFNGLEAKFTIVSASEITTTVPNGATTGPVRVITPTGKLQSNVPFTVN
jgi:uncharacterized repeat protein (TIGR03803 family)